MWIADTQAQQHPVAAPLVEAFLAGQEQLADPVQGVDLAATVAQRLSMKKRPLSMVRRRRPARHGPRPVGRSVPCFPIIAEPRSSLYRLLVGKDYVGGKLAPVAHLVLGPSRSH